MSKKVKQAYKRGIADTLLSIAGISIWAIMIIAYGYIKFM